MRQKIRNAEQPNSSHIKIFVSKRNHCPTILTTKIVYFKAGRSDFKLIQVNGERRVKSDRSLSLGPTEGENNKKTKRIED